MTREEAIGEIKSWTPMLLRLGDKCTNKTAIAQHMAIKALEKEQKWIPVSEKLPMKGTQVLCCNKYGSVFTSELTWSKGYLMFGQHSNVIAWMSLPEPYKAESEE